MTADRSPEANYAVDCGAAGLGPFAVQRVSFGDMSILFVNAGKRVVEISVSPTGRSVRVFVDGKEAKPGR